MENINKRAVLTIILAAFSLKSFAQNPLPGQAQKRPVLLKNATIHIGNGTVLPNASLLFDKGKILDVGTVKNIPSNAEILDLKNQHVYPGLISMGAELGLNDVESIAATVDKQEMGSLNPNVRTLVAYNTDSDVIPTVRANGVLLTQATPEGGLLTGQSSVFELDGWNWQDAVLKADDGIWLQWPAYSLRQFNAEAQQMQVQKNEKRKDALNDLKKLMSDALAYSKATVEKNLKLEAVQGLFNGTKVLYIRANGAKEIIEAVQWAKDFKVKKIAIVGASHAAECLEFIKSQQVSLVLDNTHLVPSRTDDPVYSHYSLPAILQQADIPTVISYAGMGWRSRNLAYLAGTAVAHGLDKEQALKMISLNAAQLMGIDKLVGSLEVGKMATLVVCKEDILDMKSSEISQAFIQGRAVDLNNKHKQLYEKFGKHIDEK